MRKTTEKREKEKTTTEREEKPTQKERQRGKIILTRKRERKKTYSIKGE